MDDRFSVKEAAQYIGASERKLRMMALNNELPHYKIGTRYVFRKAKLDEWIAKQETASGSK